MTKLSVNINKIATLRNSRGGDVPNLIQVAKDIESFGAQGITVHPRPDQRHIRSRDVYDLKEVVKTELNIEGNPRSEFKKLVLDIKPTQVTLVPDEDDAITSNSGWDIFTHRSFLKDVITEFKESGIRTSIFMEVDHLDGIEAAAMTETDRIELYTEKYALEYAKGNKDVVDLYSRASRLAKDLGMGVNAGHDLNLKNVNFFIKNIPYLDEISIGHALISESLYYGLQNVINMYLNKIGEI